MEGDQSEDVQPEDADPVREPAAAVDEAEDTQADGQESQKFQNPWPHLKKYFVLKSRDMTNANVLHFRCVMCHPKETVIDGQTANLYNLKSQVKRKHPAHATQFEERIKSGSLRGKNRQSPPGSDSSTASQSSHPPAKKRHQPAIGEAFGQSAAGTSVRQSVVDTKIVDMFVCNMLPLYVVASHIYVSKVIPYPQLCGGAVLCSVSSLITYLITNNILSFCTAIYLFI
ncbi:uncharacterized protein LOC126990155 [Eriocheir sinensis]|uniref:uncharacterized protein LOC126990155 n=1 Tax=Eriocheir sinensis TaxID=95602 RepID=UPI0021C98A6B|nr:uncharacterized protein LOC126990155 [Eriocheir sinensis]